MTNKTRKLINAVIKVSILVLAAVFIYSKLSNNQNLDNFRQLIGQLSRQKVYGILVLVFLLMLLNWVLEAFKWQYLIRPIQRVSLWKAIESVFCGLTLAVFTPNRIGEYGGRVFFLTPRKRVLGVIIMGVGAVGQMVVTNILGACAILWFIGRYVEMNFWLYYGLCTLTVLYCFFFLLLYFNIRFLLAILNSIKFLSRFRRFFRILGRYHLRELLIVFFYSLCRFVVFTSQYCLIISLLIPEIPLMQMIMMIFILFFIQSALPSLDLMDVGVRTMTATYFFSFLTNNDIAIMAATASIWFVNLIIPAILGSVFVFKLKFFGTKPD
ncbi:lysylphosphatidylglycerol synthase domain-containing protein [Paradesertivirga mongoliensis]|uniref:Lysylphosphatidylglycerol synthase domain-containing protein n=1 Tax=Paradesertivirga mongoliensis TaxID=2100740 RepID=A0ABW4ZJU3_9SPHI|nr:lysylphosphatidylglycerol synthase domain-containing protein [Pedobacter mongoliensis]